MKKSKERDLILAKTGGMCAYCGCELQDKRWHIDHVLPIVRLEEEMLYPKRDCFENKVASCIKCNNYKHALNPEEFRNQIKNTLIGLNKLASYGAAKRFGLITENNLRFGIRFHFDLTLREIVRKMKGSENDGRKI